MVTTRAKPRASSTNSRSRGRRPPELRQFEAFCSELQIDLKPFKVYPEQLDILAPYFDGAEETIVILPKKNGKSTLIAALVVYHVLVTPDAECIVVAASREQAEIILRQARKFIRQTPGLAPHLRVMRREILSLQDEGRARVLASDEDTADGVLPTLAIVDELHRHKTSELYAVLRLAVGTTGGRMITISTAGSSMDTPLGDKRRRAYEMPGFKRDQKKRRSFVRSPDGSFAFIEWCLNLDDDPNDLKTVKLVNPAPWKTLTMLAKEQAAVTPWQWLRFGCGIWTEGEEPAVPPELWDPLGDAEEIPAGSQVWVAVALGIKRESTAIATLRFQPERIDSKVQILEGNVTYQQIQDAVRALVAKFDVLGMVYVSKSFEHAADELEAEGLQVIQQPLSEQRMEMASATFWKLLEDGKFHHDGDPVLRSHVMGATTKQTGKGWRFDPATQRPITGLLALAAGCEMTQVVPVGDVMFGWA
jgi:hypothetical protein